MSDRIETRAAGTTENGINGGTRGPAVCRLLAAAACLLWTALLRAQAPPAPGLLMPSQEPSLVENGEFEQRTADGWVQGWERTSGTADATVTVAAEGGNAAIRITGRTRASRGGLQAPLRASEGEAALRVAVRYRGIRGQRTVLIRREGESEGQEPFEHKIALEPSPQWRPFEETVNLPEAPAEGGAKWLLILQHEGQGETWYDGVRVMAGAPAARPAQPPMAVSGPYLVQFHPADGATVRVNPPRLRWPWRPGVTYRVEWSTAPEFTPETTQRVEGLALNLFTPPEPLAPGTWFWRVTEVGGAVEVPPPGEMGPEGPSPEEGVEAPMAPEAPGAPAVAEGTTGPTTPTAPALGTKPKRKPRTRKKPAATVAAPAEQSTGQPQSAEAEPTPPEPSTETTAPPPEPGPEAEPEVPMSEEPAEPGPEGEAESLPHAPPPVQTTSPTRSFRVDETAVKAPIPSVESVMAALPPHPRVWLTMDRVVTLRSLVGGALKPQWEGLKARLEELKGKELPAEPKQKGKWRNASPKDLETNEGVLRVAAGEAGLVRDFVLAGLVGQDPGCTEEAKRRALNLAGWDAEGSTGYVSHDQACREVLLGLALALDWMPEGFTEEERAKVTAAVTARGEALLSALKDGSRPLNAFPYSSHGQTAVGFLAVAGLASAGEVPEAGEWLRFALPTATTLFSPWAGDDGGWTQGETYWKRSAPFAWQLFDALRTATGADLYALPWAANTARYKVYMHPPYSPRGGFGDGPEAPPDGADRLAMLRLASARSDPLAAWYAQSVVAPEAPPTAFDLLWREEVVPPQAPDGLPPSAAFLDSGLFAMHTSPTDPKGMHLYGRASGFGTFSHAHADQNSFRLEAFGEPLLIDAGYYDWYRSPHSTSFSRTSLAHNTVLVNKTGQRTDDITAVGKVERFLTSEAFDYAEMEAGQAYPRGLVSAFRRRIVFLRPSCFVVWDHVESGQRVAPTWLLHSLDQPTIDPVASTAVVRRNNAAVAVGAFGTQKLAWQSSSKFPKNPTLPEATEPAPAQWHTSLVARGRAESVEQIALLAPFEGQTAPTVKALEVTGGVGGEVIADWGRLVAIVRAGKEPTFASGELSAEANCLVALMGEAGPQRVFAEGLKSLKKGETVLLGSALPVLVAGVLGDKPSLVVETTDKTTVTIAVAAQPASVLVDGQETPVSWADGVLTVEVVSGRHEVRVP